MKALTRVAVCRDCGEQFESMLVRGAWTVRCPACADIAQRKPSVIEERNLLYGPVTCVVESLPGEWHEFEPRKSLQKSYVIDRAGSSFGKSWAGRIVIRADQPYAIGDVVLFEEIEALHNVLSVAYTRHWTNDEGEEKERQVVMGLPPGLDGDNEAVEEWLSKEVARLYPDATVSDIQIEGQTLESHRYVRLSAPEKKSLLREIYGDDDLPRLVWATAPYKTTLKGYGRQYAYKLTGSPLWAQKISGGYRSGRAGTMAVLALTDATHPIASELAFDQ